MTLSRVLVVSLCVLACISLSGCTPGGANPFSTDGDGRVYNAAKRNYERVEQ